MRYYAGVTIDTPPMLSLLRFFDYRYYELRHAIMPLRQADMLLFALPPFFDVAV